MLSQVNTYLVQCLALRLVHRDGIAQPKWELASFDGQSTSWQSEPKHNAREDESSVPHQGLYGNQVSADLSHYHFGVVHQPILYRDVSCYHAQTIQLQLNLSSCSGTPGDFRELRNSVESRLVNLVSSEHSRVTLKRGISSPCSLAKILSIYKLLAILTVPSQQFSIHLRQLTHRFR